MKETVIGLASYPVCLPNGRHLGPGETAEVAGSPELDVLVASGLLYKVAHLTPPSISTAKRTEAVKPETPAEENS